MNNKNKSKDRKKEIVTLPRKSGEKERSFFG